MKLSSLRMKPRLIGAFAVVAIMTAVVGWRGVEGLSAARAAEQTIAASAMPAVSHARSINTYANASRISLRSLLIPTLTSTQRDKEVRTFSENWAQIDKVSSEYDKLSLSAEAEQTWKEAGPAISDWRTACESIVSLASAGKLKEAQTLSFGSAVPKYRKAIALIERIVDSAEKQAKAADATFVEATSSAYNVMIIFCIGAVVLAVLLGFFIATSVVTPSTASVRRC